MSPDNKNEKCVMIVKISETSDASFSSIKRLLDGCFEQAEKT